jgi:predicted ATPase/DNA-binding winged helix-turn-helix (wHTH) protein
MEAQSIRFGLVEVRPAEQQLLYAGQAVPIAARAFEVLLALLEQPGRLVSKGDLFERVWRGVVVEEGNLHVQISALRKALGPDVIATIPGRGYRFMAQVQSADAVTTRGSTATLEASNGLPAHQAGELRTNLPQVLPTLIGRADDLVALGSLIERHRLVSIVGACGIGKTRLAQALLDERRKRYEHGVYFVELAPVSRVEAVPGAIAAALGVCVGVGAEAVQALVSAVTDLSVLIALDNAEYVVEGVAKVAEELLGAAPRLRLLVTSQAPLKVPSEHLYRLGTLAVPQGGVSAQEALSYGAVALFAERAQAIDRRFVLTDANVGSVIELCRRLDGMALAIELAAARAPLMGVAKLLDSLDQRLRVLTGGRRTAPARHQTLRAALEWSYGLLSDDERTVLDRLGVFVGSFSLESAQLVAADERMDAWVVLDHLAALVDKSLVSVQAGEPPRYRLLETARTFALERLAAIGATALMRRRHARALVSTFEKVSLFQGLTTWVRSLAPDLANLRAAAAWATSPEGERKIAIELAGHTSILWLVSGLSDEGARLCREIEPWIDKETPAAVAARFWLAVCQIHTYNSMRYQAEAGLKAAHLFRTLGDRKNLFYALGTAARNFSMLGDDEAAGLALAEANTLLDTTWPPWTRGFLEYVSGQREYFCALDLARARTRFQEAWALLQSESSFYAEACETHLLLVEYALQNFLQVIRGARDMLKRHPTGLTEYNRAVITLILGAAQAGAGQLADAEETLRAAMPLVRRATGTVTWAIGFVILLVARQERHEDAARLIGFIDGSRDGQSIALSPGRRLSYNEALTIVSSALDTSMVDRLRSEGRALSEEAATVLALPATGQR